MKELDKTKPFDAAAFDRFLSQDFVVKPAYVYVHPKLYKNRKRFWKWFLKKNKSGGKRADQRT